MRPGSNNDTSVMNAARPGKEGGEDRILWSGFADRRLKKSLLRGMQGKIRRTILQAGVADRKRIVPAAFYVLLRVPVRPNRTEDFWFNIADRRKIAQKEVLYDE